MPAGRLRAEQRQRDEAAVLNAKLMEIPQPIALEGKIVGGTWDVTDGSAAFQQGDTASSFGDDSDQNLIKSYPIMTSQPGDYYGPVGGESALVFQSQCGNVMGFIQSTVNPPQVPSGERWILHYNQSGQIDSFIKHTNDGPTTGDGLGGAYYGGDAALTTATTKSGHQLTLNDTNQTAQLTSADGHSVHINDVGQFVQNATVGGHTVTLNDANQQILVLTAGGLQGQFNDATQIITHIAGTAQSILDKATSQAHLLGPSGIGIGNLFNNLASSQAGIVNNDIESMLNGTHGVNIERLVDLKNVITAMITAMTTSGVPSLPTAAACIAQLASLVNVPTPSGSSIVRLASTI